MARPTRSKVSPWIESLVLSYGDQAENSSGWVRAHVIGVGRLSPSQDQGPEGPTGLLFLSDGVLQIPAILTAAAWERLQEQEDRESITSLVNTTVCVQDYRLQFHMAPEQTRCRFIVSVGELATVAVGPVRDSPPCSTTLASIRLKICQTWRSLLGQETQDSQRTQFDLSELLGEWQHDCLQAVLEDVRERLTAAGPQPSTSTCSPPVTHPDTITATSWGVDRVRHKGGKCFTVPIKCLLIPEEDAQKPQTPQNVGCRTSGLPAASEDGQRDFLQPPVDDAEWRIAKPAAVERDWDTDQSSPGPVEDDMIAAVTDSHSGPLTNPWDMFPPPCGSSSSSDGSPEVTPSHPLHHPTTAQPKSDHPVIFTSTQRSVHSSEEHSFLPPYQKLLTGSSTSESPTETRPSNQSDEHHTGTAQLNPPALDQDHHILQEDTEENVENEYRKAKRKRGEPTSEKEDEEEAQISGSPPSWLFDTQTGSKAKEGCSQQQGQLVGTASRRKSTAHSDGNRFSYAYRVSGQNLQDFSRFRVSESLLHWAVKYLVVPKQTDNPHNTSVTCSQTSPDWTDVSNLRRHLTGPTSITCSQTSPDWTDVSNLQPDVT